MQKKVNKRFGFVLVAFCLSVGAILYSEAQPAKEIRTSITSVVTKTTKTPMPTPFPFQELTIPYLRQQSYASQLGPLEQIDQNDSYTSYRTSYSSEGLKINGLITVPTGETPKEGWPAIVFIHGYIPPTQYKTRERYVAYVDYLASRGFVVFKIDLRGHDTSEGQPTGAYYASGYVIDALNAYAALESTNTDSSKVVVNPKKIGIWGHSMAGNIALRSWAVKKDIPAIAIWAGAGYTYEDLLTYKINDESFNSVQSDTRRLKLREQIRALYGQPSSDNPFWKQVAPINYLSELNGAIALHHAVDDSVVNIGYSRDLMKLLDKTTLPHTLDEYPTGGHNIRDESFDLAMQRTVDFFDKYLK